MIASSVYICANSQGRGALRLQILIIPGRTIPSNTLINLHYKLSLWLPTHSGILLNEMADSLAKMFATKTIEPCTYLLLWSYQFINVYKNLGFRQTSVRQFKNCIKIQNSVPQ